MNENPPHFLFLGAPQASFILINAEERPFKDKDARWRVNMSDKIRKAELTGKIKAYARSFSPWEDIGADLVGVITAAILTNASRLALSAKRREGSRSSVHSRSILKITGLRPSVQQFTATFPSSWNGSSPPYPRVLTLW
jgi:hypothetical protein